MTLIMNEAFQHTQTAIQLAQKGDFSAAQKYFLKAYECEPDNPGLLINLIRIMQMQDRHQDVINQYDKQQKRTCDAMPDQLLYIVSKSAKKLKKEKQLLEITEELHKRYPKNEEVSIMRSEALLEIGSPLKAIECLTTALQQHPDNPSLITNLAIAQSDLGQYKIAEELYKRVVKLQPNKFLSHYNLGLYYKMIGKENDALESFNRCLIIVPSAPEAQAAINSIKIENDNAHTKNTFMNAYYKLIEAKEWTKAATYLSQNFSSLSREEINRIGCELPRQQRQELRIEKETSPDQLVDTQMIFKPSESIIEKLIKEIKREPTLIYDRASKPTRKGLQSHEILANAETPVIMELKNRICDAIDLYAKKNEKELHLDSSRLKSKEMKLSGWSVVLQKGGYQKRHTHPEAALSGVIYLQTPENTTSCEKKEGNLIFSTPEPLEIVPSVGMIVLFPSYLPHETIPISSLEERICVAFNLL